MTEFDLIIVGGGPAGLTAALYAIRAGLKTVLFNKGIIGGQVSLTDSVQNYPGFKDINGLELMKKFEEQVKSIGLKIIEEEVIEVKDLKEKKLVKTKERAYECLAVIIATGSHPKKLGVKGEKEFNGKGVHFCALCDGPLYKDKKVAVVGGGDSAVKEALFLANIASRVYVIHRRDQLRAEKFWQEKALKNPRIEFIWNSVVQELKGKKFLGTVVIKNTESNKLTELNVSALFEYIGLTPNTDFVEVKKEDGLIISNEFMETNIPGIFAAGDCRKGCLRQISTCIGEGATAAISAQKFIEEKK